MSSGPHFDVFQRRVVVRGRLVVRTGLHIGTEREPSGPVTPDNPVVCDADGNPIIPGSSLKGALRSFLERLADAGWLSGSGAISETCYHHLSQKAWEDIVKEWKDETSDKTGRELATKIYANLCPACRLMGAPHYAGRLSIRDLPVVAGTGAGHWVEQGGSRRWQVLRSQRAGVGIDRELGTAATNVLYDIELVPPGTAFDLEMLVENPTDDDLRNLVIALIALRRGDIRLGGGTTRGLGRVTLRETRLWDLGLDDTQKAAQLRSYILGVPLDELPSQPLDNLAAHLDLIPAEPRRVPLARIREALPGDAGITWRELLMRLEPLFHEEVDEAIDEEVDEAIDEEVDDVRDDPE